MGLCGSKIIYNENDPNNIFLQDKNKDLRSKNDIRWNF